MDEHAAAARTFSKLTTEQELVAAFERDGYLVIEGWFSDALRLLEEEIGALLQPEIRPTESMDETLIRLDAEDQPKLYRIAQLTGRLDAFFDINRACVPFAKALLPDGVVTLKDNAVLLGLPKNRRLFYDWHQESSYITAYPNFLTYWIPMFAPSTVEGGTMSCLEGSHRLGPLPFETSRFSETSTTSHVPRDIDRCVAEHREVHFLTDPGDLVMIHQDVIHRSTENRSHKVRFTGSACLASLTAIPDVVQ